MIDIRIAVECFGDTLLIEKLRGGDVYHIKGNGNLKNYFEHKRLQDSTIVGITDFDKNALSVFNSLGITQVKASEHIQAYKRQDKNHYLIFINPAFEKFLMTCCGQVEGFKIPDFAKDLKSLKKKTKDINISASQDMEELIVNLIDERASSLVLLNEWISEFLIVKRK